MNISIDNRYRNRFIHPGNRYFMWITEVHHSVYNPVHIWDCTCTSRCYTHEPTVPQSATCLGSSLLDALTVPSTHYVSNSCIYFQSHLLLCYLYKLKCNRFNHHERTFFWASAASNNPQFSCCNCTMTSALHVLQKYVAGKYSLQLFPYVDAI